MERFNWQSSLRVYHTNTTTFRWCGAEASRADEVRQRVCLPEFVQIQENPGFLLSLSNNHDWIFFPQVFMSEFSSLRFSIPVRLLISRWCCAQQRCQECDRTLEEITRRRVNFLPWLGSLPLRQAEHSSRSCARPNMFALQTSQSKSLYSTGVPDSSVIPTATRKFIRLRKLTDKSTSLCSMPTLWVHDTAEFIPIFLNMVSDGTEFAFTCVTRFVRIVFYECVDKVLCWAKARVATSRRYLWPGYWR
jgi:hypothetical protein